MRNANVFVRVLMMPLALMILLGTLAFADAAEFTFALNADGNGYVVTGYTGSQAQVKVPDWYNQKPVTEIGDGAFQGKSFITSVNLPSTITVIGAAAFKNCTGLSSLTTYQANAEPPAVERIPGDVNDNGVADIHDALLVMQYTAGWNVSLNTVNSDVDANNTVNLDDALLILQYGAGQNVTLQ